MRNKNKKQKAHFTPLPVAGIRTLVKTRENNLGFPILIYFTHSNRAEYGCAGCVTFSSAEREIGKPSSNSGQLLCVHSQINIIGEGTN